MPLLQIREINPHVYLGFWEITEKPEELYSLLKILIKDNQPDIPTFTSVARQRQWLAGRLLAYTLLLKFRPEPVLLQTQAGGKPEFPGTSFGVSISHSRNLAVVILADGFEVGTDIEFISPKVMRVRNKFMSAAENRDAGEDLEKTLIYWSGKETLYKLYSKKQLVFKEHLFIKPFNLARAGAIAAEIITPDLNKSYTVQYETLNQHILTYSIDN